MKLKLVSVSEVSIKVGTQKKDTEEEPVKMVNPIIRNQDNSFERKGKTSSPEPPKEEGTKITILIFTKKSGTLILIQKPNQRPDTKITIKVEQQDPGPKVERKNTNRKADTRERILIEERKKILPPRDAEERDNSEERRKRRKKRRGKEKEDV